MLDSYWVGFGVGLALGALWVNWFWMRSARVQHAFGIISAAQLKKALRGEKP